MPLMSNNSATLSNGLFLQGLIILADRRRVLDATGKEFIQGFVQANLRYRELDDEYLNYVIFATNDISLYWYDLLHSQYQIVGSTAFTVIKSFKSCRELLMEAIEEHLGE